MHAGLRLIRPANTLVSFAGTVVGALAARGTGLDWDTEFFLAVLVAAASTACVTAGGNVINDLLDRDSDRVNHPDRPIVTGAVSVSGATRLAVGLLVVSAALMIPLALDHLFIPVIWALAVGSLLAYEFRFKARGLSGNALVAFLTAAVFLYGAAVTSHEAVVLPLAAMAFGATLSREVIKDMEDAGGDVGRRTLPRVYGMRTGTQVARAAVAGAIALSPLPAILTLAPFSAAGIMYLGLVLATDALFVVSVAWLPNRLHGEQSLSKAAMTVALLAFLAVAFR
ncbi:MAG TPA: geranylgeranylglycerol-phosphate geranylgeranyltransferase [Thermoplasmata archaeon]|nr:geranylgeranylglycerol-phosphate geranylgeranyltransferase [Thermoplasmata archaeon]